MTEKKPPLVKIPPPSPEVTPKVGTDTPEERRHQYTRRAFMWLFAPFVERWHGLSLTRFLAIAFLAAVTDIAHDWITAKMPLGWSFCGFVLGGYFLAAVMAFGSKFFDKLLDIVGAKLGVFFAAVPVSKPPANP